MDRETVFFLLGLAGAILTTSSWIPQILRAATTRRLDDLSWGLLGTFGMGALCWLAYGIGRADPLIVGANALAASFILTLALMKWRFQAAPSDPTGNSS